MQHNQQDSQGSSYFFFTTKFIKVHIISYGIIYFSSIRELCEGHLKVPQPLYTNKVGAGVTLLWILVHMYDIMVWEIFRGYFPDPTNILLVVYDTNLAWREIFLRGGGV